MYPEAVQASCRCRAIRRSTDTGGDEWKTGSAGILPGGAIAATAVTSRGTPEAVVQWRFCALRQQHEMDRACMVMVHTDPGLSFPRKRESILQVAPSPTVPGFLPDLERPSVATQVSDGGTDGPIRNPPPRHIAALHTEGGGSVTRWSHQRSRGP